MKTLLTLALLIFTALAVSGQSISAPELHFSGPAEFDAVITATDLSNIAAYEFNIVYDPEVLALQYTDEASNFGCATTGISSGMAVQCNSYPGRLRVVVYGGQDFSGTGDLIRTQWVTTGDGNYTDLHFDRARIFLWFGEIFIPWNDGSVSIGSFCGPLGC